MTQRALSLILMAVFVLLAGCATEAEAAWGRVLLRFKRARRGRLPGLVARSSRPGPLPALRGRYRAG